MRTPGIEIVGYNAFRAALCGGLLLALAAAGCRGRQADSPSAPEAIEATPSAPPLSSEADRTRRMDEQARAIADKWQETQTMEGTDAEKERAVQELLDQQQQLNRTGEGENPPPE